MPWPAAVPTLDKKMALRFLNSTEIEFVRTDIDTTTAEATALAPVSISSTYNRPLCGSLPGRQTVLVIEPRAFYQSCIAQALRAGTAFDVITASRVHDCEENILVKNVTVAVLCVDQRYSTDELGREIDLLLRACPFAAVIVVSDSHYEAVMTALSSGARGFVPIDASIELMTGAIMMIAAGGTFVPANAFMSTERELAAPPH